MAVPPSDKESKASLNNIATFYHTRLATDPRFLKALQDALQHELSPQDRRLVYRTLTQLSSAVGTSKLLIRPSHAFVQLKDVYARSALLSQLQHGTHIHQKHVMRVLQQLILRTAFTFQNHPHLAAMGYADVKLPESPLHSSSSLQSALVRLPPLEDDAHILAIDCDVLIVGTGPASCMTASILCKAGYKVLMVEQGPVPTTTNRKSSSNHNNLWNNHGQSLQRFHYGAARVGGTQACAPLILAASTLGGGTTIGQGSLMMLDEATRKLVEQLCVTGFERREQLQGAVDFVTRRMGLSIPSSKKPAPVPTSAAAATASHVPHNRMNKQLLLACDVMGFPWETTLPTQSASDQKPNEPYQHPANALEGGGKSSGIQVFLQEATKFGVKIIPQCRVTKIVTQPPDTSQPTQRPRVIGAECILTTNNDNNNNINKDGSIDETPIKITARRAVIVNAGALYTPCLLKASNLSNKHIGKHLSLSPSTTVFGFMEEPVDSFLGLPQTVVCKEFERGIKLDGFGSKILCYNMNPGLLATTLAWTTPYEYKERLRKYRKMMPLVIQQRDIGQGSVSLGHDGVTPVVKYSLSVADRLSMTEAMKGAVKLLAVAGAKEITTGNIRDKGLRLDHSPRDIFQLASDLRIKRYINSLSGQQMGPYDIPLFSTYQTGTCRMSTSPYNGVVDTNGECWEVDNLFVMDSSIFPTAPSVNPLLIILVIGKLLGSRLATRLRYEDQQPMSVAEALKVESLMETRSEVRNSFHPRAACTPSVRDLLPHILLWLSVIIVFVPLLYSQMLTPPPVVVDTHSLLDELVYEPFGAIKSAWRTAADFLTF